MLLALRFPWSPVPGRPTRSRWSRRQPRPRRRTRAAGCVRETNGPHRPSEMDPGKERARSVTTTPSPRSVQCTRSRVVRCRSGTPLRSMGANVPHSSLPVNLARLARFRADGPGCRHGTRAHRPVARGTRAPCAARSPVDGRRVSVPQQRPNAGSSSPLPPSE